MIKLLIVADARIARYCKHLSESTICYWAMQVCTGLIINKSVVMVTALVLTVLITCCEILIEGILFTT